MLEFFLVAGASEDRLRLVAIVVTGKADLHIKFIGLKVSRMTCHVGWALDIIFCL